MYQYDNHGALLCHIYTQCMGQYIQKGTLTKPKSFVVKTVTSKDPYINMIESLGVVLLGAITF